MPAAVLFVLAFLPRGWIAFAVIVPLMVVGFAIGWGFNVSEDEFFLRLASGLVGVGAAMAAVAQGIRLALPSRLWWIYILLLLVMPVLWFLFVILRLNAAWTN